MPKHRVLQVGRLVNESVSSVICLQNNVKMCCFHAMEETKPEDSSQSEASLIFYP